MGQIPVYARHNLWFSCLQVVFLLILYTLFMLLLRIQYTCIYMKWKENTVKYKNWKRLTAHDWKWSASITLLPCFSQFRNMYIIVYVWNYCRWCLLILWFLRPWSLCSIHTIKISSNLYQLEWDHVRDLNVPYEHRFRKKLVSLISPIFKWLYQVPA